MSFHSAILRGIVCVLPLFLLSCAGQAPPSGGPIDTEPPVILSVSPAPNTTSFTDQRISLEFDEYVDHRSLEGSIFISPFIENLEFDWSKKEVEIIFLSPLKENTTYVVTVGTDVVDLNNKNRMAQAFTMAFSTGPQIDQGAISGRVFPAKPSDSPSGIMIFAYGLNGINPDTLNPGRVKPDYITQTGKDGSFFLGHVAFEPYRLIAVRDEYKNLLYDPETDEFGVPSEGTSLSLRDTMQSGLTIRLAKEDTTAPRLVKVTPVNTRLLVAEFSESIDTLDILPSSFSVTDTTETRAVRIISVAQRVPKTSEFFLGTELQQNGTEYRLRARDVRDLAGHPVSPIADAVDFTSSDSADTLPPGIAGVSLADSARNIPMDVSLGVSFSEPVQRKAWTDVVQLRDSLNRTVACEGSWVNDAGVTITPIRPLNGNSQYRLAINTSGVKDLAGNTAKDTTTVLHFLTQDPDLMSSIEGVVRDSRLQDTVGSLVISARNVEGKSGGEMKIRVQSAGAFILDRLVEGRYTLEVYRDRNENGRFDPGRVFPFERSERFSVYPDTLKLRARWPLEGVQLELK